MRTLVVFILTFASICSTRPAQDDDLPYMAWERPHQGFPAEALPLNLTMDQEPLDKPLSPETHSGIAQSIVFKKGVGPRGPELVASLASHTYKLWMDTANLRITETTEKRRGPFPDFKWVTTPNLEGRGVLNPLKVGVVSCWIMLQALREAGWPGEIHATIWDSRKGQPYAVKVGTLDIINVPRVGRRTSGVGASSASETLTSNDPPNSDASDGTSEPPPPSATPSMPGPLSTDYPNETAPANTALLDLPSNAEKRFLYCFGKFYLTIMYKFFNDYVSGSVQIPTHSSVVREAPCRRDGPFSKDTFIAIWYPPARADSPHRLTWDRVARGMLEWITRVAWGQLGWGEVWVVRDGEVRLAELRVRLDPPAAAVGRGEDGAATA